MIAPADIAEVLGQYDRNALTIATLGGHSALDVCRGAKKHGFRTVVIARAGREKTFTHYYHSRDGKGIVDETIVLDSFADVTDASVQDQLRSLNALMVQNRYFWVYCDYEKVENEFRVPILGTRGMVRLEERDTDRNQYYILKEAGIRIPELFRRPEEIYKLAIVKVNEAARGYERAFFFANSPKTFNDRANELLTHGTITEEALTNATIEEYIVGAQVNFNFYYSSLTKELELMGTDVRRQTNLDGLLRLPAEHQVEVMNYTQVKMVETGHIAVTVKESLLEKAFDLGERFVAATQRIHSPGIIGPFALQGAVTAEENAEDIVIFDVSMRIPGSPGTAATPYSGYLHGDNLSYGERIAMEVTHAVKEDKLTEIVT